ncbi:MAG: phenylalanine--tRNA ligase subunit beta [Synergistaceae bacterium]|nr:phenylalanine--tRNA ligase subunit beta [Synergistaceae bacterium]
MLVSWNLLKLFVDTEASVDEIAERLTFSGSEVEGIAHTAGKLNGVVAAKIISLDKHPSEGKYFVATLDTGAGRKICVTSAKNMKLGDMVFYAGEGSMLPDGTVMGTRDFEGVMSYGMMLSAEELGLHDVDDPSGLLILPNDATAGDDARSLYHIDDTILDVSVTPNRGDLLSILGIAREIKGLFPKSQMLRPEWLTPAPQVKEWPETFGRISLPDKGCFAYRLGLASGAKISGSPLTVKIDLAHLGMRPINNAVDVTNYVMLMLGQPLHAFDLNTLPAREITVRAAHKGETMITLDGKERLLTERDMLITSGGEAVALAGVMGGQQTGINQDTSTIVVESASFSPVRVGHTSRRLGINSEAAFRFSRTVDPALSVYALVAASNLLKDWCGAEIDYKPIAAENEIYQPKPIALSQRKLSVYLSWDDMNEAARILEGFGIKQVKDNTFLPPTWRPDIAIEEDLIEEIGRFRGYNDAPDKLPGELPRRADIGDNMRLAGTIRQLMTARGYTEVLTYSFLPENFTELLRLNHDDLRAKTLNIANPISRDQMSMRTSLLPGLLMGLKAALSSGWRGQVRAFEQGRVFIGNDEPEHLAGLVYNGRDNRSPNNDRAEAFFDIKADVIAVLRARGLEAEFKVGSEPFMHSGQCAHVWLEGKCIGWLGRLKPVIEQNFDVAGVYAFEIDLAELGMCVKPVFRLASSYPASFRDISLLVARDKSNHDVLCDIKAAVLEAGNINLDTLRLFDVYEGKGIPEGFRSLAYSLSYRSEDRTLKDDEVEAVHNNVRENLKRKGYVIR